MFKFRFIQIFSIVYIILVYVFVEYAGEKQERKKVKIINLVEELHSLYKDAFENEKTYVTRRLFAPDGNTQYTLHVHKLREVNGVKTHNLRVESRSEDDEPIIYINNPVEARMPNPFLGIEEFKKVMFERAEKQKKEFLNKRNPPIYHKNVFKDNLYSKIFNVQEHGKSEVQVRHKAENLKMATLKINRKVNKKRKPKNRKLATKAHKKTTTTISNEPYEPVTESDNETVTSEEVTIELTTGKEKATVTVEDTTKKTTSEEEISMATVTDVHTTIEMSPTEETTTETSHTEEITTETSPTEEMTTETPPTEKITTETSPTQEITTEASPTEKITTEASPTEEITTETSPAEDMTTENVVDEEDTETITDTTTEATTTTTVDTTTETTVTTKRTRQARPYVFIGN